jgi:hypothetical protein
MAFHRRISSGYRDEGRWIMPYPTSSYSEAVRDLLAEDRLMALGPGDPNEPQRARLESLTLDRLFPPAAVRQVEFARACLAGLWLYHDFLDESHNLSQSIHTAEGSYWHGILHRREPDYANAAYWFRRVGRHPIFEPLCREAAQLDAPPPAAFLTRQTRWDPFAFIDLCEASADEAADCHALCRQVQRLEWELLFDWCYRQAVGT